MFAKVHMYMYFYSKQWFNLQIQKESILSRLKYTRDTLSMEHGVQCNMIKKA